MLNQLGFPLIKIWGEKVLPSLVSRPGRLQLTPEFNADGECWRPLLDSTQLTLWYFIRTSYSFCSQWYSGKQASDAAGDAMGGYFLESGAR